MTKLHLTVILLLAVFGVGAQNYNWNSLPVGGAGFVTGIITTPSEKNLIYARTDVGGAYRWNDATGSWEAITDFISEGDSGFMGIESLAIDPQAPNKVYIYCGTSYFSGGKSAILYSNNYGATWVQKAIVTTQFPAHGNDNGRQSGERLAVDPNLGTTLFCGSRTRGVWKSVNEGKNWTRLDPTTFPNDVKVAFVQLIPLSGTQGTGTPTIYVGLQRKDANNLFVSNDNGATWNAVEGQLTTYMTHRCLLSNGKLYITYSDSEGPGTNGTGAIQKYDLTSKTFTDISPAVHSFGEVSVDPTDANSLMCVTVGKWMQQSWTSGSATWGDHIFLSKDDGKTWKNLFPSNCTYSEPDILWLKNSSQLHWAGSAKIDPFNKNRAFIISGNGIYMTENLWDAKPKWRMALKGFEETVPLDLVSIPDGPVVTAIGDYDGFVYHDITKYYTRHTPSMGTTTCIAYAGKKPAFMVRVGSDDKNQSIYMTENGGTLWKSIKQPATNSYQGWCAIGADGGLIVWTPAGTKSQYTTDKGATWTAVPGITTNNIRFFADLEKADVFYTQVSGQFRTYTFNRVTNEFTYTSAVLSNAVSRLTVVPGTEGELWAARGGSGLTRISGATTGTPSLTNITLGSATCVGVGKAAKGKNYPSLFIWGRPKLTDAVGLYRSDDEAKTWVRINDDQHQFGGPGNAQFVIGDMNVFGRVYMSTVGRSVVVGELDSNSKVGKNDVEKRFTIHSNIFSETLGVSSPSRLKYLIYSLSGVVMEQGMIDGAVQIGSSVPHGMHLLVVSDQNQRWSEKIIKKN